MPIRLSSALGSQQEGDAFEWAADHGADVISCSWGPSDGAWYDPNDPLHNRSFSIPASTKLAIDYATTQGRNGKGCVIFFAAGNGNESVENDGYASYENVIAVAACGDRSIKSVYSDFGKAIWCAFPSSDFGFLPTNHPDPLTTGIWTTDRVGAMGYNPGDVRLGDGAGLFTNDFGGTSSSCPGAAGVAALILSVNPDLKWQ
jgi:subtilisin family serine protease